jgi:TorA maturation chaperone TorD
MTRTRVATPISFAAVDDSDEIARAELCGLLAQLWLHPPDEAMLQQSAVAVTEAPAPGAHLQAPWMALVAALRSTTAAAAAAEHEALFHGVGKPEIFLHGSFYLSAHVQTWLVDLCNAVQTHPRADTWRAVAAFTRAFVEAEAQGFDLLET